MLAIFACSSLNAICKRDLRIINNVEIIPILTPIIKAASGVLTSSMLPNKKLNKSTEKPPLALANITPIARHETKVMSTAESPDIFVLERSFCNPM